MWGTIKRPNLLIIGINDRGEAQMNGRDQICNKTIGGMFPQIKERHNHTDTESTQEHQTRPEKK